MRGAGYRVRARGAGGRGPGAGRRNRGRPSLGSRPAGRARWRGEAPVRRGAPAGTLLSPGGQAGVTATCWRREVPKVELTSCLKLGIATSPHTVPLTGKEVREPEKDKRPNQNSPAFPRGRFLSEVNVAGRKSEPSGSRCSVDTRDRWDFWGNAERYWVESPIRALLRGRRLRSCQACSVASALGPGPLRSSLWS